MARTIAMLALIESTGDRRLSTANGIANIDKEREDQAGEGARTRSDRDADHHQQCGENDRAEFRGLKNVPMVTCFPSATSRLPLSESRPACTTTATKRRRRRWIARPKPISVCGRVRFLGIAIAGSYWRCLISDSHAITDGMPPRMPRPRRRSAAGTAKAAVFLVNLLPRPAEGLTHTERRTRRSTSVARGRVTRWRCARRAVAGRGRRRAVAGSRVATGLAVGLAVVGLALGWP